MTRGRPPRQATGEAFDIAQKRGAVIDISVIQNPLADLVIFSPCSTAFVRVKRTRSHISGMPDITAKFEQEILLLRRIPLTNVLFRELWVRSPRGSWQYFRIAGEGIIEIRSNGGFGHEVVDTTKPALPPGPAEVLPHMANKILTSGTGAGFICPFFEQMKEGVAP
jgi:hypothetical protein